ncbi:MAG: Eukaryotic translation initiation factor 3 subunit H [Vezdaea aestivalis]|nr:MAG: Eukaryotic translation initiation factor 3 subunit H [Vezdaea aestivalis]
MECQVASENLSASEDPSASEDLSTSEESSDWSPPRNIIVPVELSTESAILEPHKKPFQLLWESLMNKINMAAELPSKESPIKEVQLESVAVMKINKHCADNFPSAVTGFLVGMDINGTLEVTNSFNFLPVEAPASDSHHDTNSAANLAAAAPRAKYNIAHQGEMLKLLKEVNIDANNVGWYTSCNMGNFVNMSFIENQFHYQKDLNERTIALVHDVGRSAQGASALRAFRLSPAFMAAFKKNEFTTESLQKTGLTYKDILIELPIRIHNSHLATQWLNQIMTPKTSAKIPSTLAEIEEEVEETQRGPASANRNILDLNVDPFLEKSSELLLESVETHHTELNNYQYYQRQVAREQAKITAWQQKRKQENLVRAAAKQPLLSEDEWKSLFKLPTEPSRLESMLNSLQIEQYAGQIDSHAATTTTKMFAVKENLMPGSDSKPST